MADNLGDRLQRAVRPKDPNNTDGPHFMDTSGTMTLTNGGGGVSQVDSTAFIPGVNSLSPIGAYVGGRQVSSGNIGAPAMNGSGMLIVAVGAGGAGGGVAQLQVMGTEGNWFNVGFQSGGDFRNVVPISGSINPHGVFIPAGSANVYGTVNIRLATPDFTVWLANQNAGAGFATVGVYGSPAMPVYVIGTVNVNNGSLNIINFGGSVGALGIGGSMGVTQIGAPWSVTGSQGVTPLATFTVSIDKVATINLGLGTVNIGNIPTVLVGSIPAGSINVLAGQAGAPWSVVGSVNTTPLGVQVVDTRASLTATTWPISFAGSGYYAIAVASLAGGQRSKLYAIHVTSENSAVMSLQSPSGSFLTGSIRMPGAAGFNMGPGLLGNPLIIGASNATLFLHIIGSINVGGWAAGWVEAG